jgi:hypothetical protein
VLVEGFLFFSLFSQQQKSPFNERTGVGLNDDNTTEQNRTQQNATLRELWAYILSLHIHRVLKLVYFKKEILDFGLMAPFQVHLTSDNVESLEYLTV